MGQAGAFRTGEKTSFYKKSIVEVFSFFVFELPKMNSFDFSLIEEQDPSLGSISLPINLLSVTSGNVIHSSVEMHLAMLSGAVIAAEGHRVLYDREVPFEIRNQIDPHDTTQEVCRRCLGFFAIPLPHYLQSEVKFTRIDWIDSLCRSELWRRLR